MGVKLTCTKCKEEKPYGEFYSCKKRKNGKMWKCKECTREYQKIYKRNATAEKKKTQQLAQSS